MFNMFREKYTCLFSLFRSKKNWCEEVFHLPWANFVEMSRICARGTQSFRDCDTLPSAIIPLMHICRAVLTSHNQSSASWVQFNGLFPALSSLLLPLSHLGCYVCILPRDMVLSLSLPFLFSSLLSTALVYSLSPALQNNAGFIGGIVRRTRNLRPSFGFLE